MSMLPTREQLDEQARMEQMYGLLGMNQSAPAPAAAPAAAAPAAAPAVSAEMSNLDRLNQLMTGGRSDYIRSLGTLDKIGLIGSVFKNINRPDAPDPVQARRQQEIAGLQGRMQVEQLRAAAAQRQQQMAFIEQQAAALPPEQAQAVRALAAVDPAKAIERLDTEAFRQRQVMRTVINAQGETINQYLDGTSGPAGFELPPETSIETFDVNGDGVNERVPMNTRTREPMTNADGTPKFFPLGMTPAEIAADLDRDASRAIQQQVANRPSSSGGGSGARRVETVPYLRNGRPVFAEGEDIGNGLFRITSGPDAGTTVFKATASSASNASQFDIPVGTGGRQFGR